MTPHLWLLVYLTLVFVLGAIAIGWTDGTWRRHQDEREARRLARADTVRLWRELSVPLPERVAKGTAFERPRPRSFKHRNLRTALNARAQIERGDR